MNLLAHLKNVADENDADIYLYTGDIEIAFANQLIDLVHEQIAQPNKRTNAYLFLCTYGGDPNAAYKIAKCFKRHYESFSVFIAGVCKSAGTLIAIGANEIIMSSHGELGPLDMQMPKSDELFLSSSSLDLMKAIESLSDQSQMLFEQHFLSMVIKSGGSITLHTAADIATTLVNGLLSPIMAQIEPLRIGEVVRANSVSYEYGMRLSGNESLVNHLIEGYPSHSFVIDFEEAEHIFETVRKPTDSENELKESLRKFLIAQFKQDCIRIPSTETKLFNLVKGLDTPTKGDHDDGQPLKANTNGSHDGVTFSAAEDAEGTSI